MTVERKIIHIDMDAFYASVEQKDNPKLRGKPIVVGGSPESRGVVAAASYEARRFKIRSAMSCSKAARLCPQAIFVPPRFSRYREVSQKMMAILHEVTDQVEPLSLDEAYLDVTANKLNESSATKVAIYLKSRIKGQLGLTASAGVAPNKFLAKLASDMRKPNGLVVIPPAKIEETVRELDIEKLWGIGPATASKLRARGWNTTADLRQLTPEHLAPVLGKSSYFIYQLAHGQDTRLVESEREIKSRGAETTFEKDLRDLSELSSSLRGLCDRVVKSLVKNSLRGRTVTLKLRYSDFTTLSRSRSLNEGTQDPNCIFDIADDLMRHHTDAGKIAVRLVGVSVSGFDAAQEPDQLSLPIG